MFSYVYVTANVRNRQCEKPPMWEFDVTTWYLCHTKNLETQKYRFVLLDITC